MTTSTAYHHGDLRQAVLQEAGRILEKERLEALSVREVARRAGVSHNAPYRHFPDLERLLVALAEEGFEMLADALAKRPRREMGEAYVDFALAHPQRFRLMFGGRVKLPKPDGRTYGTLRQSFADLGESADYAAAAAWGLVHGLSQLLLDGHFATEERRSFVRSVLGAVRFSAPRRSCIRPRRSRPPLRSAAGGTAEPRARAALPSARARARARPACRLAPRCRSARRAPGIRGRRSRSRAWYRGARARSAP